MRKLVSAVAVCLFALCSFSARAGKVVTDSLYSNVLHAQVKYNVYVPTGFDKSAKKYPVVYLLHGLSGTYDDWNSRGHVQLVADELIGTGEACEMIIVMPNAGGPDTHNTWNGYFNMPGWNYEDFFFQEFMPTVEAKYKAMSDKGHRAIMGLSMGGGGSTVYCQRHPEKFSSCYAMSAWLDNDNSMVSPGAEKDKRYLVCEAVHNLSALAFLDNADEDTKAKLRTVKWFFDCGDDDFLLQYNMDMHMKMRAAKVKDEFRVRNGVHNWEYWRAALRLSLPFASRCFDK